MDSFYTALKGILDGLVPSALLSDFQGLNDILAYVITIAFFYGVLIRPILKLIKVVK